MKHLHAAQFELMDRLVADLELELSPEAREAMLEHLEWLLVTNESLNLTAVKDPDAAVRLHLIDSLIGVPEVVACPPGLLVDIGTGGGYPGYELAVATGRQALLVDSVKKKSEALGGFLLQQSNEPSISVSSQRAEELALESPGAAAVVVARAVAELPALVELAAPLLQDGGYLVALKGRPEAEEMVRGERAGKACGMHPVRTRKVLLPGGSEVRTVVCFVRRGETRVSLPRRVGLAQSKPLA